MKIFVSIFLFSTIFMNAQIQRFLYEFKYVTDSTNKSDVKSEIMALDILKNESRFFSPGSVRSDSLMIVDLERQMQSGGSITIDMRKYGNPKSIRTVVVKDYQKDKIYHYTSSGTSKLKVLDERKMNWKLLPEKSKIQNYNVQKATLDFAGRKWTAWFTTELPFQDGPYKFKGLPGLILKISDVTNSYSFELAGITKVTENQENGVSDFIKKSKSVYVDYATYKKIFKEDRENPEKAIMNLQMTMKGDAYDASGNPIDKNKMMREAIERKKKNLLKDNNPLDMELLK